eukprot:366004-Chlamydomonas_euryale.AAC.2
MHPSVIHPGSCRVLVARHMMMHIAEGIEQAKQGRRRCSGQSKALEQVPVVLSSSTLQKNKKDQPTRAF